MNETIIQWLPLAYRKALEFCRAKHIHPRSDLHDDAKQVAAMAMVMASKTFDQRRGNLFQTYAGSWVDKELMGWWRWNARRMMPNLPEMYDPVAAEPHEADSPSLGLFLLLTSRDRQVIELYYGGNGNGSTDKEVGRRLGVTPQAANAARHRAIRKLRSCLGV